MKVAEVALAVSVQVLTTAGYGGAEPPVAGIRRPPLQAGQPMGDADCGPPVRVASIAVATPPAVPRGYDAACGRRW
jgi:hypothetical protein